MRWRGDQARANKVDFAAFVKERNGVRIDPQLVVRRAGQAHSRIAIRN